MGWSYDLGHGSGNRQEPHRGHIPHLRFGFGWHVAPLAINPEPPLPAMPSDVMEMADPAHTEEPHVSDTNPSTSSDSPSRLLTLCPPRLNRRPLDAPMKKTPVGTRYWCSPPSHTWVGTMLSVTSWRCCSRNCRKPHQNSCEERNPPRFTVVLVYTFVLYLLYLKWWHSLLQYGIQNLHPSYNLADTSQLFLIVVFLSHAVCRYFTAFTMEIVCNYHYDGSINAMCICAIGVFYCFFAAFGPSVFVLFAFSP